MIRDAVSAISSRMSLFLSKKDVHPSWYLTCLPQSMNRTPLNNVPEAKKNDLRYYTALIALVVTGPTVCSAYVFALWDLTASIGLTKAFPWSVGPLSDWLTWFALALLLHAAAANLRRTSDMILRGGSPHIRTAQVVVDTRPFLRRAELIVTERPSAARISQVTSEVAAEREAA
jgi:hypothetical protein